ncbi:MAG: alpha/beta fold hydrolase [Sulfitobacter sp.]
MSVRFQILALLLVLCCCKLSPAWAQLDAELLGGNIAPDRIDTLIARNAGDPAVAFDLLGLKAEAMAETGDLEAMAQAMTLQAALAIRHPELITADLPSLHLDAAEALIAASDKDRAIDQYYAALSALRDRAAPATMLIEVMTKIAKLEAARGNVSTAEDMKKKLRDLSPKFSADQNTRSTGAGFARVEIYYATDRALTGKTRPARMFGSGRAEGLHYGTAEVTIPRTHVPGALETPSVWKLEFSADPAKHVMLQSVTPVAQDGFFDSMQNDVRASGAKDAFVFVHGYNVSFDAAAKRTAQLAHDMNFRGLPILYSWPSKGATVGYIPDTAVVRSSGRRLTHFLEDVVAKSGATTIHLIGHSMGNRALTDALELMALRKAPLTAPIFEQVIFAAPDVDKELFAQMMPTIRPIAKRLTLYASDQDWALEASRKLHGDQPRAGQGGDVALLNDHIDTIDMSDLGNDMLAHSYVANEQSAILDIIMLFWRNLDPANRCGLTGVGSTGKRQVWRYQKGACPDATLLPVVALLRDQGAASRDQVRETLRRTYADAPEIKTLEPLLLEFARD